MQRLFYFRVMTITIREYRSNDLTELTRLFNETVAEGNSLLDEKAVTADQLSARIEHQEAATCVALIGDTLCGAYLVKQNLKGRGSHVANATYIVNRNYRGRGIGYALGKHSIERAKVLGFKAMQFNSVVSSNTTAIRLWERLGFKRLATIPDGFRLPMVLLLIRMSSI
ncbi:MAG: GNAT family N-acetyltransferase [Flammeovirgaceae bacterium]|nr:GNAT family N-acetyltransferase [Flammeovirgaceae bacterium]